MWFGYRPRRPTDAGSPAATAFFQAIWDFITHFDIIGKGGITVERTTRGYVLDVRPGGKGGGGSSQFKLFRVEVADAGADTINVSEVSLLDSGDVNVVAEFLTIAKPVHLRQRFKPYTDAVITPGYIPQFTNKVSGTIPGASLALDLVIGWKPPFGTGIQDVEWMDLGINRAWALPLVICRNNIPTTINIPLS